MPNSEPYESRLDFLERSHLSDLRDGNTAVGALLERIRALESRVKELEGRLSRPRRARTHSK